MADAGPLDRHWIDRHPLPDTPAEVDKNGRGRVLAIGGSALVPGGLLLTGEAALRAGAGKLQLATIAQACLALGVAMPEAAVIPMIAGPDGELAEPGENLHHALSRCDAAIAGPAMSCGKAGGRVVDAICDRRDWSGTLVLDAAALLALDERREAVRARAGSVILTPHTGEMARMLGCDISTIEADRVGAARRGADRFGAVVALKGDVTVIAGPDGETLEYGDGEVGLATGGSGDVLAGIAGGLAARGAPPFQAIAWAVWLHGQAGRHCAERIGNLGFLARELLAFLPALHSDSRG